MSHHDHPQRDRHLMHQFDDLEQQHMTYVIGMWVFLVTELLLFGGLFAGYAVYRSLYPEAFHAGSGGLDLVMGTINTFVLLTSSLTMALSVRAVQIDRQKAGALLLVATIALGLVFLGIKAYEYHHSITHHHFPGSSFRFEESPEPFVALFYSFYFTMTGLHAAHMIIGIVVVGTLAILVARRRYDSKRYEPVEMGGLYWHFVDIIWIFLYPLLYLIG